VAGSTRAKRAAAGEDVTDQPEHLDLRSEDIAGDKVQELLHLFPEVGTEGGRVDFDRLKVALGEAVDVLVGLEHPDEERDRRDWQRHRWNRERLEVHERREHRVGLSADAARKSCGVRGDRPDLGRSPDCPRSDGIGGARERRLRRLDQRTDDIRLAALAEEPGQTRIRGRRLLLADPARLDRLA